METTIPRTPWGKEVGEWAKTVTEVDLEARDARGFHGDWLKRGVISDLDPGTLVLERAGGRTNADFYNKKDILMILWQLQDDGDWKELDRSKERNWAISFRKTASEALDQ